MLFQGLYKSVDKRRTFVKKQQVLRKYKESNQSLFDYFRSITCQADELMVGCLNIWKSTNGGTTFF